MRVPVWLLTLAGVATAEMATAQGDLSGVYVSVYVGAPETAVVPDTYPFTAEGARAFNDFDPAVDDPRVGDDCAPVLMPALLWSADPMAIEQDDGRIVMRFESGDTVRPIRMDGVPPAADQPRTALGYALGRWEDDVLIVDTTHMSARVVVNDMGQPMSEHARMTERYWREPGENDLQLEVLIDDPDNYTQPLRLTREWVWSPNEAIRPWRCFSLGSPDDEPDIDALMRMMETL